MNRARRRRKLQLQWAITNNAPHVVARLTHEFDDDGCCTKCGFDAAEWHHWKAQTYEGRASTATFPVCGAH